MSDSSANVTVVVIGGGVIGASTAHQVAGAGVTGVVLLEANELASGSSGKPLGGVRTQLSDPANIELGARSLQAFHRFHDDFGVDIGYTTRWATCSSSARRLTSRATGPASSCRTPLASTDA